MADTEWRNRLTEKLKELWGTGIEVDRLQLPVADQGAFIFCMFAGESLVSQMIVHCSPDLAYSIYEIGNVAITTRRFSEGSQMPGA